MPRRDTRLPFVAGVGWVKQTGRSGGASVAATRFARPRRLNHRWPVCAAPPGACATSTHPAAYVRGPTSPRRRRVGQADRMFWWGIGRGNSVCSTTEAESPFAGLAAPPGACATSTHPAAYARPRPRPEGVGWVKQTGRSGGASVAATRFARSWRLNHRWPVAAPPGACATLDPPCGLRARPDLAPKA